MAFDSLGSRLQGALKKISGRSKVSEKDIEEMLKEVRLSLLEADVNFKVVRSFLNQVKELALGEKVLKGLNPGEQVVKIVRDSLKDILGEENADINFKINGTTVIMLAGLQGAGKTTAVGKIASFYRKKLNKKPFLIAADIYRPAAIDQLKTLGKQLNVEVFDMGSKTPATKIVQNGLKKASELNCDLVIIDTAGRLQIDTDLMDELKDVKKIANPDEILLAVDAMTGQEAVNVATAFNETLNLSGIILTKMDGDTRGGAALSIKAITGVPIKLMSTGEKMGDLEIFYPDRLADRILGMGDVLSLIDTVTENIDEDEMMGMTEKLMSGKFNYNDLLKQFKMMKRMGSISKLLGFLPKMGQMKEALGNVDDKQFENMQAIIFSMTEKERKDPKLLDASSKRRERVAKGSGRSLAEVNKLRDALYAQTKMMKQMSGMSESQMQKMAEDLQNGKMPTQKASKGKGKGRGTFRF